jgi:hypothetical protein
MFTEHLSWMSGKEPETVMGKGIADRLGWKQA